MNRAARTTQHAQRSTQHATYRFPAEWEPHQATWLSWPHNRDTWPDELERVEQAMGAVVRALAPGETVRINVNDAAHEMHVRRVLDAAGVRGDVRIHRIPTNDAWIRDHGALFMVEETRGRRRLVATNWGFNSWGGKYPPWDLDDAVPPRMAAALGVPCRDEDLVLEGGALDGNGAGTLLTTEACLLHPNRNPHCTKAGLEAHLRRAFGAKKILWLGDGIVGDDTDGHVDDVARFVAEDTVVAAVERDPTCANYAPLQKNLERLRRMTLPDGRPLRVVELPMPRPLVLKDEHMPASYANFYIANRVVLLPVFGDPNDAEAQRLLAALFPRRQVVPIDATRLIWGLGAVHCLTQQVPAV